MSEKHKQLDGSKNCMQCAAAYMLGLPLSDVPDFEQVGSEAWEAFYEFFAERGFTAEMLPPTMEFDGDYLASGETERGTSHMVVMRGGKLLHDPHPSAIGLTRIQVKWLIARKAVEAYPQLRGRPTATQRTRTETMNTKQNDETATVATCPPLSARLGDSVDRSYHDVEVEFSGKRMRLFDASYGLLLSCTRCGGWELWNRWGGKEELLAGEYNEIPLRVYVAGILICGKASPNRY